MGGGGEGNMSKSGWACWRSQCFPEGPKNCFILELSHEALEFSVGPKQSTFPEFLDLKGCREQLNCKAQVRF